MENDCILIVDDEERMRKLIKDFLKQKKYSTIEAGDGEEALKVFEENESRIKLILLDVMMPKLALNWEWMNIFQSHLVLKY